MTYPVDDAGNPQVDFVWGNFPLQPDDQRGTYNTNVYTSDGTWTVKGTVGSDTLNYGWDVINFPTGDGGGTRQQTFTWDNHEIAITNYENYPGFAGGYPFDDTIPNVTVPNIVGLNQGDALTALSNVGLSGSGSQVTGGATVENDGLVKDQNPAAGSAVNTEATIAYNLYQYVPVTTGPIDAITTNDLVDLGADEAWMYLLGRTVKPTVGDFISVTGNGGTQFNSNNYEVLSVANDDAFNTGGTKVKLHCVTGSLTTGVQGNGGTWAKVG